METIPVLIVGVGPTGLTFAAELERRSIPFRIIDKNIKPVLTSNALATQTRTLEIWNDLGVLQAMLSRGNPIYASNMVFGKRRVRIPFHSINSLYPFVLGISQHQVELTLLEYLALKNVSVEMEKEITSIDNQENYAIATIQDKNGQEEKIQATWVIACDGGHSVIRQQLQQPFPGKELPEHFVMADLEVDSEMSPHEVYGFFSNQGPLLAIKYDQKYMRLIAEVSHDSELAKAKSLTFEQLKRLVNERSSIPMKLHEPIWTSGFWIHECMLENYRCKQVFFAGDTAHIHSPAGGQGMNTGIQDAYNLAWKLALVIQGKAHSDILVTYQEERLAVAKNILKMSTEMTQLVSSHHFFVRIMRNFVLPLMLQSKRICKKIAEQMTQLAIHYKPNLLVQDCMPKQKGPKAGMRMLDVKMDGEKHLMDEVRGIDFCLLLFTGSETQSLDSLQAQVAQQFPLVKTIVIDSSENDIEKNVHRCYEVTEPSLYLIRPDKYIGFRGRLADKNKMMVYLGRIFR